MADERQKGFFCSLHRKKGQSHSDRSADRPASAGGRMAGWEQEKNDGTGCSDRAGQQSGYTAAKC